MNCNVLENSHIIQIGNKNGPDILDGSGLMKCIFKTLLQV